MTPIQKRMATADRRGITRTKCRWLFLFLVDVCELVGDDLFGLELGEVVACGFDWTVGAEGFEDAAGVVASAHGHAAGAGDLEDGVVALAEDLDEAFDLAGAAGHLEHDGLGGEIDDAGAEDVAKLEDLGAGGEAVGFVGAGGDLDEAELADDGFAAADLVYVYGDLQFVEARADTVGGVLGRLADDGHAGGVGALGLAYGQRDDVDVEAAKERGDPGEDAGFVLDQGYECVEHEGLSVRVLIGVGQGAGGRFGIVRDEGLGDFVEGEDAGFGSWVSVAAEIAGGEAAAEDSGDGVVGVELAAGAAVGVHVREDADGGRLSCVHEDDSVLVGGHGY